MEIGPKTKEKKKRDNRNRCTDDLRTTLMKHR